TVAELAALLDGGSTRDERPPLVAGPRPEVVPLSAAQRRLWFLNRFEGAESGAAGAYNVPVVLRLRGRLDRSALVAALRSVQRRHETLRTVFPEIDGEPRQVVLDPDQAAITPLITSVP